MQKHNSFLEVGARHSRHGRFEQGFRPANSIFHQVSNFVSAAKDNRIHHADVMAITRGKIFHVIIIDNDTTLYRRLGEQLGKLLLAGTIKSYKTIQGHPGRFRVAFDNTTSEPAAKVKITGSGMVISSFACTVSRVKHAPYSDLGDQRGRVERLATAARRNHRWVSSILQAANVVYDAHLPRHALPAEWSRCHVAGVNTWQV